MKKIVHVNQHVLKANRKNGTNEPPLTVKSYNKTAYGHEVEFLGASRTVHRPNQPLSCGAVLWVETDGDVLVDGVPF